MFLWGRGAARGFIIQFIETTTCLGYDVGLDGCVSHARGDSGCFILSEYKVRRICRRFRRAVWAAADVNEWLRVAFVHG
jgi:hypothetical protein